MRILFKVSFQPANQQKLSWWSSLWTASCSSQWPRKCGTVRHRTCPPAFERDEEQIWLSLAEIQNHHRLITITYSHSSGSAWRNENNLPVSQSQSIRITNAQTEKLQPFGVLLLCVLNLDHMCQRSSLGLGSQVFAPGMLICPQKNMLFCRRAAPNFVVPQQTIQRKAWLCHNQQLLTKNKQIGWGSRSWPWGQRNSHSQALPLGLPRSSHPLLSKLPQRMASQPSHSTGTIFLPSIRPAPLWESLRSHQSNPWNVKWNQPSDFIRRVWVWLIQYARYNHVHDWNKYVNEFNLQWLKWIWYCLNPLSLIDSER